ncbi:hypothetical protein G6O69_25275 [Pseudenhygromyxa sp. WMMC2535]|uniref:hypothetical protein n=1 Tax=Pseudenhygromyxa sp. WMMC2535 TaxID=2712867 RepID=UPI0015553760|nr:hypothetical protein [Pseudenhygromyxa sp. WMMC2535]NVB41176.1 hypothetical protein [Pseudenhygromyxa sp. WMMC2535]
MSRGEGRPPLRLGFVEEAPDELDWPGPRRAARVPARLGPELTLPAGEGLDLLAAAIFDGERGQARLDPLLERFTAEVGALAPDDADFELLWVARTDWALCEAQAPDARFEGDSWGRRALRGEIPGLALDPDQRPRFAAAMASVVGLFEVYPGEPSWIRDRLSGVVLRLLDSVGPWPRRDPDEPAALWEMRLIPDLAGGGVRMARPPLDYPIDLRPTLEDAFVRRFEANSWPALQDLRRARLRYSRAGGRTPISRMLRWR